MIDTVPDILARIVAKKREDLARTAPPLEAWEREAEVRLAGRRDFRAALAARSPAIIAEIKKASPSRGILSHDFDPPRIAREYESGGAAALSVLTDEPFFQGSLTDLEGARAAVSLPVLRKDFTIDGFTDSGGRGTRGGCDPADRRDPDRAADSRFPRDCGATIG